jgi:hypothetical protein
MPAVSGYFALLAGVPRQQRCSWQNSQQVLVHVNPAVLVAHDDRALKV